MQVEATTPVNRERKSKMNGGLSGARDENHSREQGEAREDVATFIVKSITLAQS